MATTVCCCHGPHYGRYRLLFLGPQMATFVAAKAHIMAATDYCVKDQYLAAEFYCCHGPHYDRYRLLCLGPQYDRNSLLLPWPTLWPL